MPPRAAFSSGAVPDCPGPGVLRQFRPSEPRSPAGLPAGPARCGPRGRTRRPGPAWGRSWRNTSLSPHKSLSWAGPRLRNPVSRIAAVPESRPASESCPSGRISAADRAREDFHGQMPCKALKGRIRGLPIFPAHIPGLGKSRDPTVCRKVFRGAERRLCHKWPQFSKAPFPGQASLRSLNGRLQILGHPIFGLVSLRS
jgi:hypothetical protein